MKIAVASKGNQVSHHYLRCEGFRIYGFNGNTVDVLDYIENAFEDKSQMSQMLSGLGVNLVVVGGINEKEVEKLKLKGIEVISKIKGEVSEVVFALHRNEIDAYRYDNAKNCGSGCGCSDKTSSKNECGSSSCGCSGGCF